MHSLRRTLELRSRLPIPSFTATALVAAVALLAAPLPSAAVNIDWVQVGNPGNAPDTASNCRDNPNCGSVPYTYYISKYDTTNAQYAEFLNAVDPTGSNALGLWITNMQTDTSNGGISFVSGNASGSKYVLNSGFANDPVVYVNFYDAMRFANWLNNGQGSGSTETGAYTLLGGTPTPSNGLTVTRNLGAITFVPSENEWYKAAYFNGTSYFAYPYGTNTPPVCAAPGPTPNTANCATPQFPLGVVGHVTPVGAYTGSASPYGTYDQLGNVFQWNEQFVSGGIRNLRGGSFSEDPTVSSASSAYYGFTPENENEIIGFRVASLVPEPGTGLLVLTGITGLAIRRRDARGAPPGSGTDVEIGPASEGGFYVRAGNQALRPERKVAPIGEIKPQLS